MEVCTAQQSPSISFATFFMSLNELFNFTAMWEGQESVFLCLKKMWYNIIKTT